MTHYTPYCIELAKSLNFLHIVGRNSEESIVTVYNSKAYNSAQNDDTQ